jgi:hypothetical protein
VQEWLCCFEAWSWSQFVGKYLMTLPSLAKMRFRPLLLTWLMCSDLGAVRGTGLAQSAELTGQVKTVCGWVIPGATVTLSDQSGVVFRTFTDGFGRYRFSDISRSSDEWVLAVDKMAGFEAIRRDNIRLSAGVSHPSSPGPDAEGLCLAINWPEHAIPYLFDHRDSSRYGW